MSNRMGIALKIGLDIGSTTIKCVVTNHQDQIVFRAYERHYAQIVEKASILLQRIMETFPSHRQAAVALSGSAGMGLAQLGDLPFVQEVYATRIAALQRLPGTDVIIELGGEDAKILFLTNGVEVRMNGSCAGGTGAFIDQMSTLLHLSVEEMDEAAAEADKIYPIASRCGVFAKSDIQPLLNQGAKISNVSASIFAAVVNQTIVGLAQGRPIAGRVVYLGGPLTFIPQLRAHFDRSLKTQGHCPEDSLYFVALGTALMADQTFDLQALSHRLQASQSKMHYEAMQPLFEDSQAYEIFRERHEKNRIIWGDPDTYAGEVVLGIDAGSTTVKLVVADREGRLLLSHYQSNQGNPIPVIKSFIEKLYREYPHLKLVGSAVTGYGEDLIRNAFSIDQGIVETVAHFTAAKAFLPEVDFIIDIGGQDIKCFKIRQGHIDNLFLNEACSSGCGSFLQTFANALDQDIESFARRGLMAQRPVDLGSRCTVFMNSSVKQAQKDGASIEDISAGLSTSVVKNALYKVIRPTAAEPIGRHIVVQGGTFLNDAVLRAFEKELGLEVVRPSVAGLMGAYGAALYVLEKRPDKTTTLDEVALNSFKYELQSVQCRLCTNHCQLSINHFGNQRRYISGNRCQRPITQKESDQRLNLYEFKRQTLDGYRQSKGQRGRVGLPLGLNMYELLPFWQTFFSSLGYEVVVSPGSSHELYLKGQGSIPSDTICYPAKLVHGHIQALLAEGVDAIFYPCMTYNVDEGLGDNHFNCPVVAYYPEVIAANLPDIQKVTFIYDYLSLHRPGRLPLQLVKALASLDSTLTQGEIERALRKANQAQQDYLDLMRARGRAIIEEARKEGRPIIVLAGRPYHIDEEINHGIDKLILELGAAVISEDVLSAGITQVRPQVLNQWTYHARLYAAAQVVSQEKDMELVQLVSFGCGVDAITTDEIREMLEENKKIYTQIKIDEINNLGAVRIRLRSLLAAIAQ